ncbi:MAG TPA: beta-ketoacyl synthase N-terminal-like domain-containing protein, partial [Cyclobacteriaceae bacterium]|nr:beta-ketoacyl synthase N-terminal-like domain-containing protein [Cyclobacteriaceae bacterium]
MISKIYVVGMGVISAIGNSVAETLTSFEMQRPGLGKLTLFKSIHDLPVGEVKLSNEALAGKLKLKQIFNRTTMLGIYAARQAVRDAGLSRQWRTGVSSGTTVGGMDRSENFFLCPNWKTTEASKALRDHECGSITERIAEDIQATDAIVTINTACSSSVNSIMYATRLIRAGKLDVAVAGGTDSLTRFTINGFNSLMI